MFLRGRNVLSGRCTKTRECLEGVHRGLLLLPVAESKQVQELKYTFELFVLYLTVSNLEYF